MQADPDLTRTVLVTTKLDTKLPQFSEGEDLEDFLRCLRTSLLLSSSLLSPLYLHLSKPLITDAFYE